MRSAAAVAEPGVKRAPVFPGSTNSGKALWSGRGHGAAAGHGLGDGEAEGLAARGGDHHPAGFPHGVEEARDAAIRKGAEPAQPAQDLLLARRLQQPRRAVRLDRLADDPGLVPDAAAAEERRRSPRIPASSCDRRAGRSRRSPGAAAARGTAAARPRTPRAAGWGPPAPRSPPHPLQHQPPLRLGGGEDRRRPVRREAPQVLDVGEVGRMAFHHQPRSARGAVEAGEHLLGVDRAEQVEPLPAREAEALLDGADVEAVLAAAEDRAAAVVVEEPGVRLDAPRPGRPARPSSRARRTASTPPRVRYL